MTPAEHYAEAERWLSRADEHVDSAPLADATRTPVAIDTFDRFTARAQVHAILATADPDRLWPLRKHGIASVSDPSITDRPLDGDA